MAVSGVQQKPLPVQAVGDPDVIDKLSQFHYISRSGLDR